MSDKEIALASAVLVLLTAVVGLMTAARKHHSDGGPSWIYHVAGLAALVIAAYVGITVVRAVTSSDAPTGANPKTGGSVEPIDSLARAWELTALPLYAAYSATAVTTNYR